MRASRNYRKDLIRRLDTLFSVFIRYRDKLTCQRCGSQYEKLERGIQNSHFWSRRHMSTRFYETNCESLCGGCHILLTGDPAEHRRHKLARIGQVEFDLLEYRARSHMKLTAGDLEILCDVYAVKIETLQDRYDLPEFNF